MALIPRRALFLTSALLVAAFGRIEQPVKMLKEQSAGSVEPKNLTATMIANSIWGSYGIIQHKIPLMICNPVVFASMAASLVLWFKSRAMKSKAAEICPCETEGGS